MQKLRCNNIIVETGLAHAVEVTTGIDTLSTSITGAWIDSGSTLVNVDTVVDGMVPLKTVGTVAC